MDPDLLDFGMASYDGTVLPVVEALAASLDGNDTVVAAPSVVTSNSLARGDSRGCVARRVLLAMSPVTPLTRCPRAQHAGAG